MIEQRSDVSASGLETMLSLLELDPFGFIQVDGVHYDTSCDHNWGSWEYNYPNYPLVIGKGNESILGGFFEGEIDDVAIWNRALSDEEIANLYDL